MVLNCENSIILSKDVILIPSSVHLSLNATQSISVRLTYLPESPRTPGHFKILNNSDSSSVSVMITHGTSVTFIMEFRSSLCIKISWLQLSSINASKSFNDTASFSFPNLFAASSISLTLSGLEKFSIARFAPVYRIFLISSWRLILPPAIIGILITRLIRFINVIVSSCSSSESERSSTINSSAP